MNVRYFFKYKLIEKNEPLGRFSHNLLLRGKEYLSAFEKLTAGDKLAEPYASYFLFAHALELILKSYLVACGVTKKELREKKLGHNIENIYKKCAENNIGHIDRLQQLVERFHDMTCGDELRYPRHLIIKLPLPSECANITRNAISKIEPTVSYAYLDYVLYSAAEARKNKNAKFHYND
ncbi:hypothetical protein [Methylobacterium sp. 174MFSha1.1]|uniref:hypothetical protein n=1 Tax=Methylobacterium sp. 174MFSha1.1 TaxID=1502749 RepID=UPI001160B132|nr:hypothetical protein [Methylobacterium sp. 174MFSha1.1]